MLRQECAVGCALPDSGEVLADPRRRVCWRRARDAAAACTRANAGLGLRRGGATMAVLS